MIRSCVISFLVAFVHANPQIPVDVKSSGSSNTSSSNVPPPADLIRRGIDALGGSRALSELNGVAYHVPKSLNPRVHGDILLADFCKPLSLAYSDRKLFHVSCR